MARLLFKLHVIMRLEMHACDYLKEEDLRLIVDDDEDDTDMDSEGYELLHLLAAEQNFLQLAIQYVNNRRRDNPYMSEDIFNLDVYDDITCERLFRFQGGEIRDIVVILHVPDVFVLDDGSKFFSLSKRYVLFFVASSNLCLCLAD
ncbi:hypothetical protein BGZ58_009712 [Dissophora ornata]|nr:hypothetical protein BGZ58_009712 [Dissophora ornata]